MSKKYPGGFVTNLGTVGYSVYFDETGDYLTLPSNSAFAFGTGDFTIECWVLTTVNPVGNGQGLFQLSNGTLNSVVRGPAAGWDNGSGCWAIYYGTNQTTSSTVGVANTWYHVAYVRNAGTTRLYINGTSIISIADSANYTDTNFTVGGWYSTGFLLNGYLSNFRVVKGTALYTANFTPPTQLLNVTNTSLLTCNSPAIVDQSSNNFAITVNGNTAVSTFTPFPVVNPAPTSAFPLTPAPGIWTLDQALQYTQQGVWPSIPVNAIEDVFSTYLYTGTGAAQSINNGIGLGNSATNNSSISLNASTPAYLTFSSQVNLSGNFCIQAWLYPNSLTGTRLLFSSTSDTNVQFPRIQENGGIYCYANGTEILSGAAASALTAGRWTHLAMTRSGSTFRAFVDGVLYGSATYSGTFNLGVLGVFFFSGSLFSNTYAFDGLISNAQIVTGSAIYTADFTPPQNILSGGAVLLGAGATPLADTSGSGKTVTQFGSPAASSSGPWAIGANKGGLVWCKARSTATSHGLFDTARGVNQRLSSNGTTASAADTNSLTAFNSNGFSLGADPAGTCNTNADTYASWTFREQAKFFDVVTYTGNGVSGRTVSHNLGSVPGCVITKKTSNTSNWAVYHRGITSSENGAILLNSTDAWVSSSAVWNNTAPTATNFTVGTADATNINGETYVAYLFAHNAGGFGASGADNVISCGSYTGTGAAGNNITLGYEPQWLMVKRSSSTGNWVMLDVMRGFSESSDNELYADLSLAEGSGLNLATPQATGFQLQTSTGNLNASGSTYIYIAIRRGPMRPPSTGTSVYNPVSYTGNNTANTTRGTITTDLAIMSATNAGSPQGSFNQMFIDRLRGEDVSLTSSSTGAETTGWQNAYFNLDQQVGWSNGSNTSYLNNSAITYVTYILRRAPGFFDVVCYDGSSSSNFTVTHNLGVSPELVIAKSRSISADWGVYTTALGTNTNWLRLNTTGSVGTNNGSLAGGAFMVVSSSQLQIDANAFAAEGNMVAYLFATVAGVSKVGSYTGTGTTQTINCGFTAGSRFVMIKRTDSTGDWYVWDSARGIVAGNDPYLLLNSAAAEVTNTDYVDTANSGFEISSTAPAAINANGGTFIFLAIA